VGRDRPQPAGRHIHPKQSFTRLIDQSRSAGYRGRRQVGGVPGRRARPLERSQCPRDPLPAMPWNFDSRPGAFVSRIGPLAARVSPNYVSPRANRRNSQLRMGSPVLRCAA
jgi:hypothetical protein